MVYEGRTERYRERFGIGIERKRLFRHVTEF